MRVRFFSLGCKANQADSGSMAELLRLRGHEVVPERDDGPCDAVIVNTCAVTATAERKSRTAIRALRAAHPAAILAVCGCLPEAANLLSFPGTALIGDAKDRLGFIDKLEVLATNRPHTNHCPLSIVNSSLPPWRTAVPAPISKSKTAAITAAPTA